MFKKLCLSGLLLSITLNATAGSYIWSSAIPTQVHIVPEGLVLVGTFKNKNVNCSEGSIVNPSIFLPKSDINFDHKLSLALTANAAKKKIEVLLETGVDSNCVVISAGGNVPVAHNYYWRLID